jgi:hypothetical protein
MTSTRLIAPLASALFISATLLGVASAQTAHIPDVGAAVREE